jgi:hypothetical protein
MFDVVCLVNRIRKAGPSGRMIRGLPDASITCWTRQRPSGRMCPLGALSVPLLYNDPEHWRQRAEEARELARNMTDPHGKQAMLDIADKYERIAVRAVERMAQSGPPSPKISD